MTPPQLMGIVNATPDSFSDAGRTSDAGAAIDAALRLADEGADWIDVGGESTRPGASPVPAADEIARVVPVIQGALAARPSLRVSVDTTKAVVARAALDAGAVLVNDVSAGDDPEMASVVASFGVPWVLMHRRGNPQRMQRDTRYDDLLSAIEDYWRERMSRAEAAGVARERLWLDPGVGFGKSWGDNPSLIQAIPRFRALGQPILIGASRKAFIGALTGVPVAAERVFGSVGVALAAARHGADVLRVHDVSATRQALVAYLACA